MNPSTATVTDVARHFSDYLNRTAYAGESFILVRGGKPLAELKPIVRPKTLSELSDVLASLPSLSETETENFRKDLVQVRKSVGKEGNPWDV